MLKSSEVQALHSIFNGKLPPENAAGNVIGESAPEKEVEREESRLGI